MVVILVLSGGACNSQVSLLRLMFIENHQEISFVHAHQYSKWQDSGIDESVESLRIERESPDFLIVQPDHLPHEVNHRSFVHVSFGP